MLVAVDTGHGRNTPGKRTPDDSMREHDFNGNVATKARGGEAEKIANIVQRKLIENTGRKDRGVKVSNLHMCRETNMPAILCECGFMDNREEAELLKSEEYRTKCAEAIAYGILEYLNITPVDEVKETEPIKDEGGSLEMARVYQNGSTPEPVYADTDLKKKIGELNPRETAEYLSIDNDRPLVRYKVDGTNTY